MVQPDHKEKLSSRFKDQIKIHSEFHNEAERD